MKKNKLILIPSEIGAGTRGAGMGIEAMKKAAAKSNNNIFKDSKTLEIPVFNDAFLKPLTFPLAKRIDSMVKLYERIAREICHTIQEDEYFPLIIAGDHSTAGGTIAGLRRAYPHSRIGIIWFDAHADMHSPFTTPSGNLHGMPLAAALNFDNRESAIHKPDYETIKYWEELKNSGKQIPMISSDDLVIIGLRETEPQEEFLINQNHIHCISVNHFRKSKIEAIVKDIFSQLQFCDYLYISFDVDCLDPEISKGTGTPVKGGFTLNEVIEIMKEISKDPRICCFELVEINPLLDTDNKMAETALTILETAIERIHESRKNLD